MLKNTEKTYRCSICGYLHYGDAPPETCPICDASAADFKEIDVVVRPERRDAGKERGGFRHLVEVRIIDCESARDLWNHKFVLGDASWGILGFGEVNHSPAW